MESLKRQRAALKGQVTRIVTFCDSSPVSFCEAKVRQRRLEQHMQDFERVQNELECSIEDVAQLSEETQYRKEFEDTFYRTHAKLSDIISTDSRSDQESDLSKTLKSLAENQSLLSDLVKTFTESSRRSITITKHEPQSRLPEIKLPEFSGNFDEWVRFRDLFTALVQSKESVTGIEKLEYLQTRLKGEASSIIKHLPPSNENFDVAWNLIKAHYDKPQFITVSHLDNIFDQPVLKSGSLSEIKRLFSVTSENINALRALKQPVDSWDVLLVYILSKKLDSETKVLWIREVKNKNDPSFSDFSAFLKERINELESLNPSRTGRAYTTGVHKTFSKESSKRVLSATLPSCFKCKQKHFLYQCMQFRDLTVPARCDFVKANRICPNCLRAKHNVSECKFSACKTCGVKHNTMIHQDQTSAFSIQPNTSNGIVDGLSVNAVRHSYRDFYTMLPTALVLIKDANNEFQCCRALLDSWSQATLVSESCVQRLGLKRSHARIPIVGLGQRENSHGTRGQVNLVMSSILNNDSIVSVQAFVLSTLTNDLPSVEIPSVNISYFNNLSLADPLYHRPSKIDILLGADIFFNILAEGRIVHPSGSPIARNTIFGWVISGNISSKQKSDISVFHSSIDLDVLLKQFFEHEDLMDGVRTECEVSSFVENHFTSTHYVKPDGRFVVSLPFSKTPVEFGDSRGAALKRLNAMERRFSKDPNLKREYVDFMREYERLGHMALVPVSDLDRPSFYLPHHAVLKPTSTTTKLRVVFDASCKSTNGFSLNDYLRVGPIIQSDLITCLLKFRKGRIAVKADVAKMYRQVLVNAEDVHFQRIVWREEATDVPRDYQLQTVTYGTASASFLATRVLKQIGINNIAKFPRASDSLINDFYVDDCMSTFDSVEDAIRVKNDIFHILENAGMDLRKWSSNAQVFLSTINPEHRELATELSFGDAGIKTLGLLWDAELDSFKFSSTLPVIGPHVTKRGVLSDIARIFDPLGWLSPTVVKMKIFLKRLWVMGLDWDSFIPANLYEEWSDFRADLVSLRTLRIPRWLQHNRKELIELHGFADAAESAFSAAVYSRVIGDNGVKIALICAKTRIAPVKPALSIPRLELCGSLLLTKLLSKVKDALAVHDVECFAYTDSTTVLHWIQGYPRARNIFVDNRVSQIVNRFPATIWHYVRSAENPADCATRGLMPRTLSNLELWWNGPHFLHETVISFSEFPSGNKQAEESEKTCLAISSDIAEWDIFAKFSNLNRLLRVVARCIRLFRDRQLPAGSVRTRWLSPEDILSAKIALVKLSQKHFFRDELICLEREEVVSTKSKYSFMNPFIDQQGVLRVGGRLENASIPFDQKHPIILHKEHHFTKLIVNDCHLNNMHAGMRQMIYILSLNYFIVGVHHLVKRCIYQCVTCSRQRASPYRQQMASLPEYRLEPGVTFGNTGVDYAGPFLARSWKGRGAKQYKVYVALFVCMATKALHLEVVSELSSSAFIAALRRFVARRGKCHTIYSDNGTNFVGANQRLREWANLLRSTEFQEGVLNELTTIGIKWRFSPPHAPHFGGLWEAGVKTMKYHLRRVLSRTSVTYEEFSTVLCQIEACANSRPLCTRFEGDMDPITPAHFLIARPLITVPDPNILESKASLLDRWQYLQRLLQEFWRKWSQDYINQLRKRHKWLYKCSNIQPNDVVIIKDENQPPCQWLIGRIIKTYPGRDGLVRVASVLTHKGEVKRPICKLCPLFTESK